MFKNSERTNWIAVSGLIVVLISSITGCGEKQPTLTLVKGTLTLRGEPLNKAMVRFVPQDDSYKGNYVATGVTDDDGKFVLRITGKEQPECPVGLCKVTIAEGPLPAEARKQLEFENDGSAMDQYNASLKNRPIPRVYHRLTTTTISFEVTPDKEVYDIAIQ